MTAKLYNLDDYRKTPRGLTRHEKAAFVSDGYVFDPEAARKRKAEQDAFLAWQAAWLKEVEDQM